ncbi:MAG: bile acid:sodium symporter [Rhodocyclaceae bacterium]|nr:bile acid:sodium symporter [Rhodocyclaceae bacterium]
MEARDLVAGLAPVCVFVMMACIGLDLVPAQFRALLRAPKPLLVGIAGQLLVAPAAGFALAAAFAGEPAVALAMVLVVAAPGGPVANGFVFLGRGRPDVSVSLTATNGVLSLASTPLIVHLGFEWFGGAGVSIALPVGDTIAKILFMAVLPIFLGMGLRRLAGRRLAAVQRASRRLAALMLASVLALVFWASAGALADHWRTMLPGAFLLCLAMFAATSAVAALAGLDRPLRMTIATEVGVHNVPLAIVMAQSMLARPELAAFIVLYAPAVAIVALAWALRHRRIAGRAAGGRADGTAG